MTNKIFTLFLLTFCSYAHASIFSCQPEVSINDSMQQIVAETMKDAIAFRKPEWACAILMNKEG